jgi:hypothetical protein
MIIAICDYDAIAEPQRFFPNLDVMKLSSYFKSRNHVTYSIFSLDDPTLLTMASKIYVRKDRQNLKLPTDLLGRRNIVYGGLGFTQGYHESLEGMAEDAAPDRLFYQEYLANMTKMTKKNLRIVGTVLKNPMVRLSIDGKTCNSNWAKIDLGSKSKTVTIFDPNVIELQDSFDVLESFGHKLRFRWPIKVQSLEECMKWTKLPITHDNDFNLYNYDYNNLEGLSELCYQIPCTYIVGFQNNYEEETILREIKQLIRLALYQKIANKLQLKLWYAPDNFMRPHGDMLTHVVDYFNTRFTDSSFVENLRDRASNAIPKWKELAQQDEELKFLIYLSPVQWRNRGEQIEL